MDKVRFTDLDRDAVSKVTRSVQLHENQRCWIGVGFSNALMPNDRGPYSTLDGSQSWKSLEEATKAMLGATWTWEESDSDFQEGEWQYARDFTVQAVDSATSERGAMDWVRYRVLQRPAVFVPTAFASDTIQQDCRHCDSKAVRSLAKDLIEVLTFVTLINSGPKAFSTSDDEKQVSSATTVAVKDATLLRTKSKLIEFVQEHLTTAGSVKEEEEDEDEEHQHDSWYQLQKLQQALHSFADREVIDSNILRSVFKIQATFEGRHNTIPRFDSLCQSLSERCFPDQERTAIAFCVIKRLDGQYFQMQCHSLLGCQEDKCRYKWVACTNKGCKGIMSRIYLESHIETDCPYKIVTCECGDEFPKHQQLHHLLDICRLREAPCPFKHLGCTAILKAQDIPNHVEHNTSSHLLLAMQRMQHYEIQIRRLHDKFDSLHSKHEETQEQIQKHSLVQQSHQKQMTKHLQDLQQQLRSLEASTAKDIQRLQEKQRELGG